MRATPKAAATPIAIPAAPRPTPSPATAQSTFAGRAPNADLARPLHDCVRQHAVDAERGQQQSQAGEHGKQQRLRAALRHLAIQHFFHGLDARDWHAPAHLSDGASPGRKTL